MLILVVVFALASAVQFIYCIIFLTGIRKRNQSQPAIPKAVSVVVSAHDEEENLKELIPLLLAQQYHDFEIIVVNDRSNDNTFDFLLEETKKFPRLKMVNVKETPAHINSKKFAITLGIRAAANDWILLTDADCRPLNGEWIKSMAEEFHDDAEFVLGFSPYMTRPGFLNLFIRFESLITALQYLAFARLRNPFMGVGRNLAYRKSMFLQKKGFNNYLGVLGGDDDLFVNQHAKGRNTRVRIHQDATMFSIPETTWTSFFYQKIRHLSVGRHYKAKHKLLIGSFYISWILTLFAGLSLMAWYPYYFVVPGVLVLRWILLGWGLHSITRKTGLAFQLWTLPALDFLFPIYYISTGLVTLFTKKVRWKKR